jgi:hypothetical protein
VQKYFFAFIGLQKAETFFSVIPLDFACRHGVLLPLDNHFGRRKPIA